MGIRDLIFLDYPKRMAVAAASPYIVDGIGEVIRLVRVSEYIAVGLCILGATLYMRQGYHEALERYMHEQHKQRRGKKRSG